MERGKTTIAKAIKSSSGVTYAPGKTAADYLPLVYDQDFIDANMRSYHSLPGVFTMNEANVKIQEQIDRKAAEQKKAQKASSDAFTEKDKKSKTRAAWKNSYIRTVGTKQSNCALYSKRLRRARKGQNRNLPKR